MDLPSAAQPPSPEIDFLYALRRSDARWGLAAVRALLRALGHPERGIPMLHVAGTNGKGSTTALAAAMLQAGGLRVGRFTSPHVLRVEERVVVDGTPVDGDTFRRRVRDLRPWIEQSGASFFEAMTALAAVHFRDAGVEVAVYEVGLGGRLDATNALPSSVAVLTSVGHDHEAILGRGLRNVCREKLGIVKRGVPLCTGLERRDLVQLARERCAASRAPFVLLPTDPGRVLDIDLETGMRFELRVPEPMRLVTRLLGAHQVRNAALAATAVRTLDLRAGLRSAPDIAGGAARAFLPGRFQVLPSRSGLPPVVLDVGHNPEALHATLDVAAAVFGGVRPTVVLGMLQDKKLDGAALRLARTARTIVLTAPRVERAWEPARARRLFPTGRGLARLVVEPSVEAALDRALAAADGPLIVLGSHYVLGEAVPALAARCGMPPGDLLAGEPLEPLRVAV